MHSTVFELSDHPIPAAQQATPGYLPDWFFCSVCDYATRMTDAQREDSITALVNSFGTSCSRCGDCLTFAPSLRDTYFRENLRYFKAAAVALSETDYETFAGIVTAPAFTAALNGIRESYTDPHGFYIYTPEKLLPLDNWLRTADISQPYYVGGTINYHF